MYPIDPKLKRQVGLDVHRPSTSAEGDGYVFCYGSIGIGMCDSNDVVNVVDSQGSLVYHSWDLIRRLRPKGSW